MLARRMLAVLILGAAGMNLLAFLHARAMTGYVETGTTTPAPENLTSLERLGVLLTGVELPRVENSIDPSSEGLAFESRTFTAADGVLLEAWYLPHSAPRGVAVLLHGYTGRKECVLPEARWFHDAGFACLLLDFRGSGGSEGMVTTLGWHEALDAAAAVREARELQGGQLLLYGQSMGAAAALRAIAELGAEVDVLVLESPYHSLTATVEKRFELMGVPSFPMAKLLLFWGGVQRGFDPSEVEPVRWAESVRVPTLVMHGGLDARIRVDEARAVVDAVEGDVQFHVFADARHAPILPQARAEWIEVMKAFLATREPVGD